MVFGHGLCGSCLYWCNADDGICISPDKTVKVRTLEIQGKCDCGKGIKKISTYFTLECSAYQDAFMPLSKAEGGRASGFTATKAGDKGL